MRLQRLVRTPPTLAWRKPAKCQAIQFGGLEISALSLLADEFRLGVMPFVNEKISLPVLLHMTLRFRFSRWAYYQSFIELSGASVVLVWHDNNAVAYQLRQHSPIPVICIQNGVRHNVCSPSGKGFLEELQESSRFSHPMADAYFCFGIAEPVYLGDVIRTNFIVHGSLRANAFAILRSDEAKQKQVNGIGFIVSFPSRQSIPGESVIGNNFPFLRLGDRLISYQEYYSFDALVARALRTACVQRNLELKIVGKRSEDHSSELHFFQEVLNDQVEVLGHAKGEGYELANRFKFLVTVDSTLGYEMRALGKPVAFLANRLKFIGINSGDLGFGFPLDLPADGPYWSSATTESEIVQFLHRWIESVENQETPKDSFELMRLDPGNTQLRGMIRSALEKAS